MAFHTSTAISAKERILYDNLTKNQDFLKQEALIDEYLEEYTKASALSEDQILLMSHFIQRALSVLQEVGNDDVDEEVEQDQNNLRSSLQNALDLAEEIRKKI